MSAPVGTPLAAGRWRGFEGRWYGPGEAGYEQRRLPWRRNVDARPAAIVEPVTADDVARAVTAARDAGVPFAVQATGHGALVPCDGGLLLRVGRMSTVEVDPARRVAQVGGGACWADVVAAAAAHGLAPISGSSPEVGVAGYTLGGGLGWLSRRYGFAADSLLAARVVSAGGDLLRAGPDADEDLWWALRGGGGNFGVVTELRLRLFPVDSVFGGVAFFAAERAAEVLARYREVAPDEPDELTTALILLRLPDLPAIPEPIRGRVVLALRACYAGPAEHGQRALAPLLAAAGPPLLGGFRPMAYPDTTALADPQPLAQISEEHTDLFRDLDESLVDLLLAEIDDRAGPVTVIELRHWGGALARPRPYGGMSGPPGAAYSLIAVAPELERATLPKVRAHMAGLAARLRPYASGGVFLNFLSDTARTAAAYQPDDHRRLAALKRRYDPDNVFRLGHNIPPARRP
ncbi:FAD-binding oxidoreductase [Phytohabitans aurantiacus]|uniref:FAD-linked oxidase n=1 Tax=Phytohabitans aurantiacus TaxID=3016789 RepID=A0ABQ5QZH0_9ACTN|nr:FAD-binding oxidoreductase [Phytohabitans aurantiacus]GLH99958.1 FAD-linked oxidase [Phytohabitans aurantiacus]